MRCAPAASSSAELVVAGHDRDDVRLLVWPAPGIEGDARIAGELTAYNRANRAATRRIAAFVTDDVAPAMADGELTDKGYVNQRAVLANRADLVAPLYDGSTATLPGD